VWEEWARTLQNAVDWLIDARLLAHVWGDGEVTPRDAGGAGIRRFAERFGLLVKTLAYDCKTLKNRSFSEFFARLPPGGVNIHHFYTSGVISV
jgi:hypothetical protein